MAKKFKISEETVERDIEAFKRYSLNATTLNENENVLNMLYILNNVFDKLKDIKNEKRSIIKKIVHHERTNMYEQVKIIENNDFLYHLSDNFLTQCELNNIPQIIQNGNIKFKNMSFKRLRESILDFYGKIGNIQYQIAKGVFDEKRIEALKIEDNRPLSYPLSAIENGYIFINNGKINEDLLLILTHEIAHIIDCKLRVENNVNKTFFNSWIYDELLPSICEIYMLHDKVSLNNLNLFKKQYMIILIHYFMDMYFFYSDDYKIRNRKLTAFNKDGNKIELYDSIMYTFPLYLALKLKSINYPLEEINKNFKYIYENNMTHNYEDIVKIFGLDCNEFMLGNIDFIIEKKLTKKR